MTLALQSSSFACNRMQAGLRDAAAEAPTADTQRHMLPQVNGTVCCCCR